MSSELLDRYISLKGEMARLQRQIDELKSQVATYVLEHGGSLLHKNIHLHTQVSKVWQFSKEVALLESIVKEKKRQEIETGKAKLLKETLFVISGPKSRLNRPEALPGEVRDSRKTYHVARIRERHPRAYMPWSDDENTFVVRHFHDGYSVGEIAKVLQRQNGAIRSRLKKLGEIQ